MKLPSLTAYAKAQAFGMAVSFAIALHYANQMGLGLAIYVIGAAACWLAFEFIQGRREPSHLSDAKTLTRAMAIGLALPWGGFLLAYLLNALRP
ncbi:hypothetical protein U91I_00148 [alpha proteobacterium U9-1i]|nr:hypothetical protein U91I_00148 [alpha proteobacterium U9-1i]